MGLKKLFFVFGVAAAVVTWVQPALAKTWTFKTIHMRGVLLKPQSFHLVQRKTLNLRMQIGDPRIDRDLLVKVAEAVKRAPF